MIYIPIFVNIVLLLLFDYRRLFFSLNLTLLFFDERYRNARVKDSFSLDVLYLTMMLASR